MQTRMIAVSPAGRAVGDDSPRARYLDSEVAAALALVAAGFTTRQAAARAEVPRRTLRDWLSGRTRAQLPAGWRRRPA